MKIFIACDHAAYEYKKNLLEYLGEGYDLEDLGSDSPDRCHYPDFAIKLSKKVILENGRGILLCGTGMGMSIVANRFKGIRAALCRSCDDARLSREHNNANVLCVGSRVTAFSEMVKLVDTWLSVDFAGGRHSERLAIFEGMGQKL
ncbi:MAG: ribose 5-phosphate isomerase B [Halobacteriovoraceae bacterium]|nr:ribose 5-phosphate isomerase B [Halobacteriovoraceae bacterium]